MNRKYHAYLSIILLLCIFVIGVALPAGTAVSQTEQANNKVVIKEELNQKDKTKDNKDVLTPAKKPIILNMVSTAYTAAPEENYPYAGAPSYIGMPLQRGVVAVDPRVIPMGTRLWIEGYGEAIAADQGGAIKGNRIDVFMDSKAEAYEWGMRTVKVTILD